MEKNPNPIKNLMPQNKRFMGNEKFQQKREVSGWAEAGKVRLDRLWEACSGVKVGKVGEGA
jgi:hypothetical protein